jgi:uncharacterized membrane protein
MDSPKLSDPIFLPPLEPISRWDWPPEWRWPTDHRRLMCLVFAVSFLLSLANILYSIYHPRSRPPLQNILIGPIFSIHLAAISGLAFWTIRKGKRWARGWATAASLLFILMFVRQFVVPARPAWDHHVSALLLGMLGLASFWSRDKFKGNSTYQDLNSWLDQKTHS